MVLTQKFHQTRGGQCRTTRKESNLRVKERREGGGGLNGFGFSDDFSNSFGGVPQNVRSDHGVHGDVCEEVQRRHCYNTATANTGGWPASSQRLRLRISCLLSSQTKFVVFGYFTYCYT